MTAALKNSPPQKNATAKHHSQRAAVTASVKISQSITKKYKLIWPNWLSVLCANEVGSFHRKTRFFRKGPSSRTACFGGNLWVAAIHWNYIWFKNYNNETILSQKTMVFTWAHYLAAMTPKYLSSGFSWSFKTSTKKTKMLVHRSQNIFSRDKQNFSSDKKCFLWWCNEACICHTPQLLHQAPCNPCNVAAWSQIANHEKQVVCTEKERKQKTGAWHSTKQNKLTHWLHLTWCATCIWCIDCCCCCCMCLWCCCFISCNCHHCHGCVMHVIITVSVVVALVSATSTLCVHCCNHHIHSFIVVTVAPTAPSMLLLWCDCVHEWKQPHTASSVFFFLFPTKQEVHPIDMHTTVHCATMILLQQLLLVLNHWHQKVGISSLTHVCDSLMQNGEIISFLVAGCHTGPRTHFGSNFACMNVSIDWKNQWGRKAWQWSLSQNTPTLCCSGLKVWRTSCRHRVPNAHEWIFICFMFAHWKKWQNWTITLISKKQFHSEDDNWTDWKIFGASALLLYLPGRLIWHQLTTSMKIALFIRKFQSYRYQFPNCSTKIVLLVP